MKIYIAYKGFHDRYDQQDYSILGVYLDKREAEKRVEDHIGSIDGIERKEEGSNILWIERDWIPWSPGKVEEHELITEEPIIFNFKQQSPPIKGMDLTQLKNVNLSLTMEQLNALKNI